MFSDIYDLSLDARLREHDSEADFEVRFGARAANPTGHSRPAVEKHQKTKPRNQIWADPLIRLHRLPITGEI